MTVPHPCSRGCAPRRLMGFMSLAVGLFAVAIVATAPRSRTAGAAEPPVAKPKETSVGGVPIFADWPKGQKPDAVVVFSGQTFGYLQPCGCSRPQIGGLERRAVFIESLRAKGWPVAGVDLGDIYPEKAALPEQGKLKYVATMTALRDMGYLGVGVGKTEIGNDLLGLLVGYSLQKEQRPFVLAGNASGIVEGKLVPRAKHFMLRTDVKRPQVDQIEVGTVGAVSVGVAGVVGKALREENQGWFKLTEQSFEALRTKNLPEPVLVKLKALRDKELRQIDLESEVTKLLGADQKDNFLKLILNQAENQKEPWGDKTLDFPDTKGAIDDAAKALAKHPGKPQLKVLIFQGPSDDAAKAAADFPDFQVILCRSDSDLPPLRPQAVPHKNGTKTLIVQVGHRGQYVGVLGAFKKADGTYDLEYQLVPLGEEFITPGTDAEALQKNKALQALEAYAKDVKAANLLPQYPRTPHEAQIHAAAHKPPVELTYVGTDKCKLCHAAEFNKWKAASHSHAMATLEKVAKRPSLRQFDGECVRCHTVGFDHQSGYVDEKKTPNLRDVGCESCHGPGSGHVGAPKDKDFRAYMSPWKQPGATNLPDPAFMKEMADTPAPDRGKKALAPAQQLLIRRVENMCMKCHDHEADPHFDLYTNWPKIDHTGLAPAGGAPAGPPKK